MHLPKKWRDTKLPHVSVCMTHYLLARLSEAAYYSGNPVCVGYTVLCMRFGAKFWMSDLAHVVYGSVYFLLCHTIA